MAPLIHPTAVVDPGAQLHASVEVGAHCVIGSGVRAGAGCRIEAHAVLTGDVALGEDNWVGHHAVLGGAPQVRELKEFHRRLWSRQAMGGEALEVATASEERARCEAAPEEGAAPGRLVVGSGNWIRELATVQLGRPGQVTRMGDHNLLMAYCHVAHDCCLGDHNELANGVQLAGHVQVGDHVTLGGLAAVHQFVRLGSLCMVAAGAGVSQDVLPYCLAGGDRARLLGLNTVGLRRLGLPPDLRSQLDRAVRLLYGASTLARGLALVQQEVPASPQRDELLAFARRSLRGLCRRGGRPGQPPPG